VVTVAGLLLVTPGNRPPGTDSAAQAAPEVQDENVDHNIVVQITSPRPGERLCGLVEITGYAADRRSPGGSGLNEHDIQIYLNDSADPWNLFDRALGGRDSPEAAAALGPQFDKAGFWDAWETCSFPEAPYRLTVWASSLVTPGARNFASVDVYVESCGEGETLVRPAPGSIHTERLTEPGLSDRVFDPIYADFAAGVTVRCTETNVGCLYGIVFRALPGPGGPLTNSDYRFAVDPNDGTWSLVYESWTDSEYHWIVDWTPASAIRRGIVANRVAVLAQGDWLRMFVNGQQVGETRGVRQPWGTLGVFAYTDNVGSRAVEVQFINLLVTTPGPVQELATLSSDEAGALALVRQQLPPTTAVPQPPTPPVMAAPRTQPGATAAQQETVSGGSWQYRVLSASRRRTVTLSYLGREERARGVWLIVAVRVKNLDSLPVGIDARDFELSDGSGSRYGTPFLAVPYAQFSYPQQVRLRNTRLPCLSGDYFPPDLEATVYLVWDVPPSAAGLQLLLTQARTSIGLAPGPVQEEPGAVWAGGLRGCDDR
jgi:hypothetical protein